MEIPFHCRNCGHRFFPNRVLGTRCPKCQYYVEPPRLSFAQTIGLILMGLAVYGFATGLFSPKPFVQGTHTE